jgi:hypothetical protein
MFGNPTTYGPRWRELPRHVQQLFGFGGRTTDPVYSASTSQAAIALRSFLTHGEARWAEALAD